MRSRPASVAVTAAVSRSKAIAIANRPSIRERMDVAMQKGQQCCKYFGPTSR